MKFQERGDYVSMIDYKEIDGIPCFTEDGWKTCKTGMKLDYASVGINGSTITGGYTKEAESLRSNIINELNNLKSDKPWNTNTINIECAIEIVRNAKY